MTFMPFSIPEHVSLLLSGSKRQTTRQPRKKPLKVGDILHCYYKPRWMKSCGNCITSCAFSIRFNPSPGHHHCEEWCNFFGTAKVVAVIHLWPDMCSTIYHDYRIVAEADHEEYIDVFGDQPEVFIEAWARADGFANFEEAHRWFAKSIEHKKITTKKTTSDDPYLWMFLPWDIIIFEPDWVVK